MKHYFNVAVAKEVGINAAVVFENLSFWIKHNEKAGKNGRQGTYWMFSSQKDIAQQFEYLSVKQIRLAIEKLIIAEYIKVDCFNRHKYDRTQWYALTEKGNAISRSGCSDSPKRAEGSVTKVEPIQDIKTDIDQDIKRRIAEIRRRCQIV